MQPFRMILFCGLLSVTLAQRSLAWNGEEHIAIGVTGYQRACAQLITEQNPLEAAAAAERLQLACMLVMSREPVVFNLTHLFTYSPLAGEWSALAADHTQKPEQLTSIRLGDLVVDYGLMTRLAVTNYRHFHPASTTSWREQHARSLEASVAASKATGMALIEQFEAALAVESFAQHYLQDSFAAGHMGFNRVASSNAAALTHHNRLSRFGNCVKDEQPETWYTYGDGYFWIDGNDEGRAHVIDASRASYYDFLSAFVSGSVQAQGWREAWSRLPAYLSEETTAQSDCRAGGRFEPLRAVTHPARAASTFEIFTATDASVYRPLARGLLVGASQELAPIYIGYRVIQNRVFAAVGFTVKELGNTAILVDGGYVWQIATTNRGTLTHDAGIAMSKYFEIKQGSWKDTSMRLFYGMNIEAGRVYVRLQGGASISYSYWGRYISTGIGWVRRAGIR